MDKFKLIKESGDQVSHIETSLSKEDLLDTPKLNKGCAFTREERDTFHLDGLLPYQVETLEQQAARMYMQFKEHRTNLGKNIHLNVLHDYNETLFYKLASEHLDEMLPIIYTPTVGEAVQRFSTEHRKARGLYISYPERDKIEQLLENRLPPHVDLAVVTDGGAVLGIGDQGIGGINISIAKLMVYTLAGGINPHYGLPIQLDVGTNNPHLLNDPMYLGWRHERITGQAYDDFIDMFVTAIKKKFPNIYLHWEDVGRDHAKPILTRYRESMCTMNGDIQSTGVIGLACVLAGVQASGIPLQNHRIVVMGAGNAGLGIADQIKQTMCRDGLSEAEALEHFWMIDQPGLLVEDNILFPAQKPFARKQTDIEGWQLEKNNYIGLFDVVQNIKPTILIGCSTVAGAFSEEVVKTMAENTPRPIILPLSNPNSLSEAKPEDLIKWSKGQAIIATGSPFDDVLYDGHKYRISQSNNAFAFPGIGLGVLVSKANRLTDEMLWAATEAIKDCSPANMDKTAPILPRLSKARMVSYNIAVNVAEQAIKEGVAQINPRVDLKQLIQQSMWEPKYYRYELIDPNKK